MQKFSRAFHTALAAVADMRGDYATVSDDAPDDNRVSFDRDHAAGCTTATLRVIHPVTSSYLQ